MRLPSPSQPPALVPHHHWFPLLPTSTPTTCTTEGITAAPARPRNVTGTSSLAGPSGLSRPLARANKGSEPSPPADPGLVPPTSKMPSKLSPVKETYASSNVESPSPLRFRFSPAAARESSPSRLSAPFPESAVSSIVSSIRSMKKQNRRTDIDLDDASLT